MKRFQNKVAESGLSLPVTAIGALCVWMVATSMFSGGLSAEGIGSLACFVLAVGINAGAIAAFHRPWTELYSQLGYVICIALILWFVSAVIWGIILIIKKIL